LSGADADRLGRGKGGAVGGDEVAARDELLLEHETQDRSPARLRRLRVRHRVVGAGARRQAGEQGGLGQVDGFCALVEVNARRHLDAVGAVAEVDRVQVGGEDAVLRPGPLELPGERRLLHLAADRPLLLRVRVLDELLRDRRAALDEFLVADVGPGRAHDAAEVDSLVLPVAPVLDGDDRLLHDGGDLLRAHEHPALVSAQDGEHRLPVGGIDVPELLDALLLARLELRDVARDGAHEAVCERDRHDQPDDDEEGEDAELANPPPLRLLAPSPETHEAPESKPSKRRP
jgi:hypothetical protein